MQLRVFREKPRALNKHIRKKKTVTINELNIFLRIRKTEENKSQRRQEIITTEETNKIVNKYLRERIKIPKS